MPTTAPAETGLLARATHLRELIELVLAESIALIADLEQGGIEFHWLEDGTVEDLHYVVKALRALEAVRCDPSAWRYWVDRVYLRNTVDGVHSESPAAWARFSAFHARFEDRFPELATELAALAYRSTMYPEPVQPSLERRALAAVALLAGEAVA